ncbi:hypothetical protein D3C86_1639910 [compost metagenome]
MTCFNGVTGHQGGDDAIGNDRKEHSRNRIERSVFQSKCAAYNNVEHCTAHCPPRHGQRYFINTLVKSHHGHRLPCAAVTFNWARHFLLLQ